MQLAIRECTAIQWISKELIFSSNFAFVVWVMKIPKHEAILWLPVDTLNGLHNSHKSWKKLHSSKDFVHFWITWVKC